MEKLRLEEKSWWPFIHEDLRELLGQSVLLLQKTHAWEEKFHDYAFIVFPAAKAYEGFLKTLFYDLGFITEEEFNGKRFRAGKALNPELDPHLRQKESVYDKLVAFCRGRELADKLWETWKRARNLLFHWFPNGGNAISLQGAGQAIEEILNSMDISYRECKIERVGE